MNLRLVKDRLIAGKILLHDLRSVDIQPEAAENTGGFMETATAKPEPPITHEKANLAIFNQQFNDN